MPYNSKEKQRAWGKRYYKNNIEKERARGRKAIKKYRRTKQGKKTHKIQEKRRYLKHKDKILKRNLKYQQTPQGKINHNKANQKFRQTNKYKIFKTKRQRNLNWIQMFDNPFDELEKIDYHHITDAYVVALPKDLHQLYMGKFHREKIMEIVKQIYLDG